MVFSKKTVGIIGVGWVGSSVAIATLHAGVADEVLLHDIQADVAEGEAMDLAHGAAFFPATSVRACSLEQLRAADVIVLSAGRGGRPGESRLELLQENATIAREVGRQLAGYSGIIVVVSNPVDVLTYLVCRSSGLPAARVIGTGTMLDSVRLQQRIGEELRLHPRSIHALVAGEHGDSEVVLWSSARISSTPLRQWPGWSVDCEERIAEEVRGAAQAVIRRKGASNHAIGLVTASLLGGILRGERRVFTVSRIQHGALGLEDVALSLPTVVGGEGAEQVVLPSMSNAEEQRLHASAEVLRAALASA